MSGTVAVTGATGFVGAHLIKTLVGEGWTVRALARSSQPPLDGVTWVSGKLEDEASLRSLVSGCDSCIHVAGAIKARSRDEFAHANIGGTERMLAAATAAGLKRFIHVSSLAAREPMLSDYAWSKAQAEETVRQRQDLAWAIVRPPAVYGPADKETLTLFKTARLGLAPLPNRQARLSLIHVTDLCTALTACLKADNIFSQTFEVHDGAPGGYSLLELYMRIGQALGRRVVAVPVPPVLLRSAGQANAVLAPFFNRVPMVTPGKVREILHPDWTTADDALSRLTGWQPAIQADEGLAATAAWYRAQGWL